MRRFALEESKPDTRGELHRSPKICEAAKKEPFVLMRITADHIIGIICLIVSAVMLYVSRSFPTATTGASNLTGPSFYPNILALVFALCGIGEIIAGFRNRQEIKALDLTCLGDALRKPGFLNVILIIVLIIGFIFLMEILGFIVCSYLLLFILMWRFGVSWIRNTLYSALFVTLVYLLFGKLFTIYLPSGIFEYLGF